MRRSWPATRPRTSRSRASRNWPAAASGRFLARPACSRYAKVRQRRVRAPMSSQRPWLEQLRAGSEALQGVLSAVLEAERHFAPPASPLERLRQITTSPEWAWLQPLYRLIADIDHALASAQELPVEEAAAI